MADIINERDKTLQTAAKRTVTVVDPTAIVIPGYTGVGISRDISLFIGGYTGPIGTPMISPSRMVLTAKLQGIPQSTPINWITGHYELAPHTGPFTPENPAINVFVPGGSTVILTNTPDPLVKTIEATSYPYPGGSPYPFLPRGVVRVIVEYGGSVFSADTTINTFSG